MKKLLIICLIVGLCLTVVGGCVFACGMMANGWNFSVMSNVTREKQRYSVSSDEVEAISVEAFTAKVSLSYAEVDEVSVEYYRLVNSKNDVVSEFVHTLENGELIFREDRIKRFQFSMVTRKEENKVVITIPSDKKISYTVKTSTGKIVICEGGESAALTALKAVCNTGDIRLSGAISVDGDVALRANTGDISIEKPLTVGGNIATEVNTGRISIDGEVTCAGLFDAESNTGKILIKAPLSAEDVVVDADTGDVECFGGILANSVKVVTDTGNVKLSLKGRKEEYSYTYKVDTGKSNMPSFMGGGRMVRVETDTGNINLTFLG